MSSQYLVIEFSGLSPEDNTLEIQGRVQRALNDLFAHENHYYGWEVNVDEWFNQPVEAERMNYWKELALTRIEEVKV